MATDQLRNIWRRVSALLDELRALKVQPAATDWGDQERRLMEALALLEQRIADLAREVPTKDAD